MFEVTFEYRYGEVIGKCGGLFEIKYTDGITEGVVYRLPSEVEFTNEH